MKIKAVCRKDPHGAQDATPQANEWRIRGVFAQSVHTADFSLRVFEACGKSL